jgi:peroxiredoxin
MPAEIGQQAPQFSLPDQARNPVTLKSLAGGKSLIVFIPFPFSSICGAELCTIRDNLVSLNDLDANVVVITCGTHHSNGRWSEENGFDFAVLSDFWPHGEVTKAYGVFNDLVGAANRATFLLDSAQTVRAIVASDSLGTPREFDEYLTALAAI